MTFAFVLNLDNDAFADAPEIEIARLLRDAAGRVEGGFFGQEGRVHLLKDINGNNVGQFTQVEC
jgi:hypothetical protein